MYQDSYDLCYVEKPLHCKFVWFQRHMVEGDLELGDNMGISNLPF